MDGVNGSPDCTVTMLPLPNRAPPTKPARAALAEGHGVVGAGHPAVFYVIIGNSLFAIVVVRILRREALHVAAEVVDRLRKRVRTEERQATPSSHFDFSLKRIVAGVPAVLDISAGSEAGPKPAILNISGPGAGTLMGRENSTLVPLLATYAPSSEITPLTTFCKGDVPLLEVRIAHIRIDLKERKRHQVQALGNGGRTCSPASWWVPAWC